MNAILSIKPCFVNEIIAGRKSYEFRKSRFKKNVTTVYVYASSPICRIVGEFELGNIITGSPDYLWSLTSEQSGISKRYFDDYFMSHPVGYAYEIKSFKCYGNPIDPYKVIIGFHAPQSFCYLEKPVSPI